MWILKVWVYQWNSFAWFHNLCYSKIFFKRVIIIVKLAPTTSYRIIALKKMNNIIINHFQNLNTSVFSNKWHFNYSQDYETLALDFESFSMDVIVNKIFQTLGFHISATWYLEEKSLYFIDIIDLKLAAEPFVIDNPGQIISYSKKEMVKKKNKRVAKRKE